MGVRIWILYKLSLSALIATSFALAGMAGVARPFVLIPAAVIAIGRLALNNLRRGDVWEHPALRAFVAIVPFVWAGFVFSGTREISLALGEFLAGWMAALVLGPALPRRFWLTFVSSILLVLAALIVRADFELYVVLFLYLGAASMALNAGYLYFLFSSRREAQTPLPRGYLRQLLRGLPAVAILAGLIFLALPRINAWDAGLSIGPLRAQTGYTGGIMLGRGGGPLMETEDLVLRILTENSLWLDKNAETLYLRGTTVDAFDGRNWSSTLLADGTFAASALLTSARPQVRSKKVITVFQEPESHSTVFYPEVLLGVEDGHTDYTNLRFNPDTFQLSNIGAAMRRTRLTIEIAAPLMPFEVVSQPFDRFIAAGLEGSSAKVRKPFTLDPELRKRYLAIPPKVATAPWFKHWIGSMPIAGRTVQRYLIEIRWLFQREFAASLANVNQSDSSLEEFLTRTKAGHCEYFATATALLLRARGLPARIALGYLGGTFNPISGALEVRGSNAHAWVEYFVPGYGWQRFDPTPMAPQGVADRVRDYAGILYEAVSFWFNRFIVDYSGSTQLDLLRLFTRDPSDEGPDEDWSLDMFAELGVTIAVIWFVAWWGRRRWQWHRAGRKLPRYYQQFLYKLALKGINRRPEETYRDFHARLKLRGLEPILLDALSIAVETDLYASRPVGSQDAAELNRAVRRFRLR